MTLDPHTTKNDEARTIFFTTELPALLEAQRAHTDEVQRKLGRIIPSYVFHRNGRRIKCFRKAWENACTAAGASDRIPHDLRRTAVRNIVRSGTNEKVAMTMTPTKRARCSSGTTS